jgi:cell division protein FtsB
MSDLYYRKARPKISGRMFTLLQKRSFLLTLFIVVPIFSFVTFSNKGVLRRFSLESEKRSLLAQIEEARRAQVTLSQELKALDSDPRAIEKVAREKFWMAKPGETVYKVKKEE